MGVTAAELFERHALAVYRFFRRMTRRPDVADDLTQEVFLRVVRGIHRYQATGRERGWVFHIARHVLVDTWTTTAPAPLSIGDVDEPSAEPTHVVALGFHEAVGLLPRVEREMYLLREQGGLTYGEIARVCETTEDAVRSKLLRARRLLRRVLSTRLSVGGPESG
jgi:RNA polymerase sigma-70 factor (ECF subfamily)